MTLASRKTRSVTSSVPVSEGIVRNAGRVNSHLNHVFNCSLIVPFADRVIEKKLGDALWRVHLGIRTVHSAEDNPFSSRFHHEQRAILEPIALAQIARNRDRAISQRNDLDGHG